MQFPGQAYLRCGPDGEWASKTDYRECMTFLVSFENLKLIFLLIKCGKVCLFSVYLFLSASLCPFLLFVLNEPYSDVPPSLLCLLLLFP